MKVCPFCTSEIQDLAIKCRHCRGDLKSGDTSYAADAISAERHTVPAGARAFRTLTESDARLLKVGQIVYLQPGGVITQKARSVLEEKQITVISLNTSPTETMQEQVDVAASTISAPRHYRSARILPAAVVLMLALIGYEFLGFYSIQPIGAIPDGQTWLVIRSDDEAFFESADARCLRRIGSVSLLARGVALGQAPKDRILIRLPYLRFAYLQSTGGQEFDR